MFDASSNGGEVASAVRRDTVSQALPLAGPRISHIFVKQLGFLAGFCEDDGSYILLNSLLKQPQALFHDTLADVILLVNKFWVEQQQRTLALGGSRWVHLVHEFPCQQ